VPSDPNYEPHRSYVARVRVGEVRNPGAWRFRDATGAWQPDTARAAPILRGALP
jgi:hypothetical protein